MESIFTTISKFIVLEDRQKEIILSSFTAKELLKGQILWMEGSSLCKELFFVEIGCLRLYSTVENGETHNIQFAPEGHWIADIYSFWAERPCLFSVDCLEESTVFSVSKTSLEKLFVQVPPLERYFRILIQNAYISYMERVKGYLSLSAVKRYDLFVAKYPQLIHRLPQYHIASYIGVKPQSLSRIRAERSH